MCLPPLIASIVCLFFDVLIKLKEDIRTKVHIIDEDIPILL